MWIDTTIEHWYSSRFDLVFRWYDSCRVVSEPLNYQSWSVTQLFGTLLGWSFEVHYTLMLKKITNWVNYTSIDNELL